VSAAIRFQRRELRLSLPWLLLAAAGMLLFGRLGQWQWHRAAEKRLIQQEFAAALMHRQPLGSHATATLPRYAQVEVLGSYDGAHQFLLDNRTRDGQVGYEVLTPLRLTDGRWLLVNRGWIPLVDRQRATLPDVALPPSAGEQSVSGLLDELPVAGVAAGRVAPSKVADAPWPRLTSFPQASDVAAALGQPVEARQLLLLASEPGGFARNWQPASASFPPERHLAYAVQWWSLAGLAAVLYVVLNLKRIAP
jgi:surfeit locus 1 family protein